MGLKFKDLAFSVKSSGGLGFRFRVKGSGCKIQGGRYRMQHKFDVRLVGERERDPHPALSPWRAGGR